MENWDGNFSKSFDAYFCSFTNLASQEKKNFDIKRAHSYRVAKLTSDLAKDLQFSEYETQKASFIGLYHDVGRFQQYKEYGTFQDAKSFDHAEYSAELVKKHFIGLLPEDESSDEVYAAIKYHNKFELPENLQEQELKYSKLLRDADKLDILKVLTDYYSSPNSSPNHSLTWELPKGSTVSKEVKKEVLSGGLVSKKNVVSEIDVKIMQLSWVYDLNYRWSFEYLLKQRFLELIFKSLPKNDTVIEIYRKVKVFTENQILN